MLWAWLYWDLQAVVFCLDLGILGCFLLWFFGLEPFDSTSLKTTQQCESSTLNLLLGGKNINT